MAGAAPSFPASTSRDEPMARAWPIRRDAREERRRRRKKRRAAAPAAAL
jgi:hypothetical protein